MCELFAAYVCGECIWCALGCMQGCVLERGHIKMRAGVYVEVRVKVHVGVHVGVRGGACGGACEGACKGACEGCI